MKKLLIISIIVLISCKRETEQSITAKKEIPEALKERNSFRESYNVNLIEDLYQDLVSKSPDLQKLEGDIKNLNVRESENEFNLYEQKSIDFYRSAQNLTEQIQDSLTQKKMLDLIKKSNARYAQKSKPLNDLIQTINTKNSSIEDNYRVLKIALTIPIMEQYQNENLPKSKNLKNTILHEDSLITKIQKQFPK